ncbi:SFM domain-containing protein [Aphelenchoides fujianensis]|nr:SFM domain-containing protein [Aphelenchoides fujianensis]
MSKNTGSLADKSIVDRIHKDRDAAAAKSTIKEVETFDYRKIDNPQEKEMLAEFDRRRRARTLMIPTDDIQVKIMLRRCNEPICLFGENILDRRERLRTLLSKMTEDEMASILHVGEEKERPQDKEENFAWYHRGPPELRVARVKIADFSLRRAKKRLAEARVKAARTHQEKALAKQETHRLIQSITIYASQVTGLRASSFTDFSPDSKHIVTANWSGQVSVWSVPDCREELHLQGHGVQAGCARFHPQAYVNQDPSVVNIASCDHDGNVLLWNLNSTTPMSSLLKHDNRVGRVAFHPCGGYLGTTCYDASWRMFDLETEKELLFQEGHSKGVHDLDFHPDGSLALTGSLDCYGRVWDLRTGKCVMFLDGHQKPVNTVTWHPNGFVMITGSGDNQCKIWDVRMRRCTYTLPAHNNLVSAVRVDPTGEYLISSSYDNTLKLWTTTGWQPLKVLEGHAMKVTDVSVSPDGKWIASACFDRTFKLWTSSGEEEAK